MKSDFMSGSCHLDKASNVEIGVECRIFVIVIFFNFGQVLQFEANSSYKDALTYDLSFASTETKFIKPKTKTQNNIVIFIFVNCGQVLQFGAYSRHYKGALTQ